MGKRDRDQEIKDLDFEIDFMRNVLKSDPVNMDVLMALGDDYTKRGNLEQEKSLRRKYYRDGLSVDLKLCVLRPKDPTVHYNICCSYSLLEETENAIKSLKNAISLGFADLDLLSGDSDLDNLQQEPEFQSIVSHLKKAGKKK